MSPGFLVIISAPSGTGKSTVCRKLRHRNAALRYSISCSTRARRPTERNGEHYDFLTISRFEKLRREGNFIEWAEVHGNLYGTPKKFIEREVRRGNIVLLDIDVQGADAIIRRLRSSAVTIFLLPPSWRSLEDRLRRRQDTFESIGTRLVNARKELKHAKHYDYWVVNDSLMMAVKQVEAIILTERLRPGRQRSGGLLPALARN